MCIQKVVGTGALQRQAMLAVGVRYIVMPGDTSKPDFFLAPHQLGIC